MKPLGTARRMVAKVLARAFTAVSGGFYGAWGPIKESFTGAWQKGVVVHGKHNLLKFSAVFACVTGIASDIAKLRIKLCKNNDGIWEEITGSSPWLPVLRKPNHFQNRIQWAEQWVVSKALAGNAYILKGKDSRGVVNALYVLDPARVYPLVAENGDVYYQLSRDPLSRQLDDSVVVPAREIIHDRANCLYHPLVGISPLFACALSATMGNKIQENSVSFFQNAALPGGVITVPGKISPEQTDRLEKKFKENYSGENFGNVWVLANDMKFTATSITAQAAQLEEQLKWTVDDIARAFHYPPFKLGGPLPAYAGNVEALIISYYTDCLQSLIESMELCLDEGLELPVGMGTELDIDNLLRMDTAALYKANTEGVAGGWMAPNEARYRANYKPAEGGASPYLQQQNYSLAALAKRDAKEDPFNNPKPQNPTPTPTQMMDPAKAEEKFHILEEKLGALEGRVNTFDTRQEALDGRLKAIPAGAPGERGPRGESGEKGERGLPGIRGEKGDPGIAGTPGAKGSAGETGEKGDPGIKGDTGLPGIQGFSGDRGETGPAGAPGRDAVQVDVLPSVDFSKSYPRGTFARFDGGIIRAFRDTIPGEQLEKAGWEVVVAGAADMAVELAEDLRTFKLAIRRTGGESAETLCSLPVMIYREIYNSEVTYQRGDVVTWGGSAWHCQKNNPQGAPGKSTDWRMMVKEGQRGKDGKDGERGPQGVPGQAGKDLTQLGFDGKKW